MEAYTKKMTGPTTKGKAGSAKAVVAEEESEEEEEDDDDYEDE